MALRKKVYLSLFLPAFVWMEEMIERNVPECLGKKDADYSGLP